MSKVILSVPAFLLRIVLAKLGQRGMCVHGQTPTVAMWHGNSSIGSSTPTVWFSVQR